MTPRRGIPFVVSAPSGTGKTTVCRSALARDPGLRFSVSHTTRPLRAGEREGVDYHFVTAEDFRRRVDAGDFLEHAEYNGHLYGTQRSALEEVLERGHDVLLEIEVQGAEQLRRSDLDARFIFLLPPSMEVLEERLRGRGTDADEVVHRRLALADRELAAARFFDYAVVNDELEDAVLAVQEILAAERAGEGKRARRKFGQSEVMASWQRRNASGSAL